MNKFHDTEITHRSRLFPFWDIIMEKLQIIMGWHRDWIVGWQEKLGIDDYTMMWISFGEGVLLTSIFIWLI